MDCGDKRRNDTELLFGQETSTTATEHLMLQDADLDAAVSEGIVTAEQAAALRGLAQRRERERAIELGHEERFRFMRGFNDVFFSIGVLLFIGGFAYFMLPRSAFGLAITAVVVWLLAELLVARLRLVLPGILLACAFVGFVFAASIQLPVEGWLGMQVQFRRAPSAISVLQALQYYPGGPLMFAARALVAAAAAGLFYWRFKLPFALLPLAASLVVAAIGVASFIVPQAAAVSDTVILLLCGLGVFAAAMTFDASDRERLTRRADCAFWLHLLAAPLIVHSVISLVTPSLVGSSRYFGVRFAPDMTGELALAIALIVAVLAVVAVLIDRRALLVSGLAYLGGAIGFALASSGFRSDPSFVIAATLVILGAFVLTLGTGWVPLRRLLLRLVSPAISNRLPPVPARP
jgi:hypothetical protein